MSHNLNPEPVSDETQNLAEELYRVITKRELTPDSINAALEALAAVTGQVLAHVVEERLGEIIAGFLRNVMVNVQGIKHCEIEVNQMQERRDNSKMH